MRNEQIPTTKDIHREDGQSSGNTVFGILFLLSGILLLLNFTREVPWEIWDEIWKFWPLLLILGGLQILLGNNVLARLIMLILTAISFMLVILIGLRQLNSPLTQYFPRQLHDLVEIWEGFQT